MLKQHALKLLVASLLTTFAPLSSLADEPSLFGTVDSSPDRALKMVENKITIATYVIYWDRLEPKQNQLDSAYIAKERKAK